ncbi:S1C family serine protease [Curtobacterium sp. MCSS17_007]|uniref:S1C family serine protease n=1 Tax=Curtobacterium sp. MCSS17_007 TaxID=2175646 RepID=UPI0015E8A3A2|nr:S1C family serine protease [Curtobacterium sp. MCSS17_007]WIE76814.1 S1C family serine protease [Curtobacterium sp. MCSS17_007]
MNENPADDQRATDRPGWEAPHVDRDTLRPAYAFDGSGPWLYGADGSGPYAYAPDGRGPYLLGSAALGGTTAVHHPGAKRPRRLGLVLGSGVAALAIIGAAGGTALGLSSQGATTTSSRSQGTTTLPGGGSGTSGGTGSGTNGSTVPGYGSGSGTDGSGSSGTGTGTGTGTSTQTPATPATTAQEKGVVTIDTVMDYDTSSRAAGTGMVLTSDGTVLTNNHVIQGATSITVTDETTGKEYTADVVGSDATNDVAVLKLRDASGLSTVTLDDDGGPSTGDAVTDVGNAEGTGNLVAAAGTVTALDQDIQVQSETGTGTESLHGLIEVAADIVSGDSGGPVLDSEGEVVGMATAASSGSAQVTGYAIPITTATAIADEILAGESSDTITIGLPAFLGVEVGSSGGSGGTTGTTTGVAVAGTVEGSGAAAAGLVAGDTITSIDGTTVTSNDALTAAIRSHAVGDRVQVGYTDASGTARTVTVTLTAGPAA